MTKTADLSAIDFERMTDSEIRAVLLGAGYRVNDPERTLVPVRLHKGQRAILASTARRIYAFAGTGSGKTTAGPLWMLDRIERHWNERVTTQRFLVGAPTTDLLFPAYAELAPWLKRLGDARYGDGRDGFVRSTKTWHLRNGALVRFRSLDRPGGIEGVHYRAAWIDEGGQIDDNAHAAVIRRIAFYAGDLLVTTTPYTNEGWTRRVVDEFRASADPEIAVLHFPSYWNPAYSMKEFERILRTEPAWRIAMFYLGLLTKPEGAAYPNFDTNVHVVEPFEPLAGWGRYAGLDFGANHPTAIAYGALSPTTDVLRIYREWVEQDATIDDIAAELLAHKVKAVYADPSARQIILSLRAKGVPIYDGTDTPAKVKLNDVKAGVANVHQRLADRTLLLMRGKAPRTIAGLERLRWEGEHLHKVDDDEADAVRYLVMGLTPLMRSAPLQPGAAARTQGASRAVTAGQLTKQW